MTVASTTNRKTFTGDSVTTSFGTSPVVFFTSADLTVFVVNTTTGAATTLVENTDYTVTGGAGLVGTINLAGGSAPWGALATGTTLVILRSLSLVQSADFVQNDGSDAEVTEAALDKLTMMAQQLNTQIGRSFVLATSDVSGASTAIPTPVASTVVGWNDTATALQNYSAQSLSLALTTPYTLTLLDDATAPAARLTLGFPAIAAKGDLFVGSAANTIAKQAVGTDGYLLQAQSGAANGVQYLPMQGGFSLLNGYLDWTVAASALTCAIKTFAGTDPSATDPVYALVRSVTTTTGLPSIVKITAANSVVVSSGSTLGTRNGIASRVWAVLFDDAGTYRLGVINCLATVAGAGAGSDVTGIYPLAGWGVAGSTAEGGAGAADSAQTFYTGTAVTAKPYTTLGYATFEAGQATAGTWATAASRKQLFGPGVPLPGQVIQVQRNDTGALATGTTTIPFDDTIPQSTEGDQYMSQAVTPSSAANVLEVEAQLMLSSNIAAAHTIVTSLFQDATANALRISTLVHGGSGFLQGRRFGHVMLAGTGSATTLKVRAGSDAAGTIYFNGVATTREFGGVCNSFLAVKEIMA